MTRTRDELFTGKGEPRGFIDFVSFKQLWVHIGTNCNLCCPSCFEQSGPGVHRIESISFAEVAPKLDEATRLGVQSFGFTGGEPFLNPEFMHILEYALTRAPCLVLSNGTGPLHNHIERITLLAKVSPYPLSMRISLDTPNEATHDANRGNGHFRLAINALQQLQDINIAVARRKEACENEPTIQASYERLFEKNGLPKKIPLIAFPNLHSTDETPEISENCMTTYHTPETSAAFMCAYSRMIVKKNGAIKFYACTLVDDDSFFDFGEDMTSAIQKRTILRHKRCFSCFSHGVSCGV